MEKGLAEALGGEPPRGLIKALDPGDLETLAELVSAERRRQRIALAEAQERALDHVPRLLRGTIKRIVRL